MFGREHIEHQAAMRLLGAIREAKIEIGAERLAAILERQAELAEGRISGDTDWLGDPGTLVFDEHT